MKQLLKWAGKDRKWLILSVLCGFCGGLLAIFTYMGIYQIMDGLVSGSCDRQLISHSALMITTSIIGRQILVGISGILSHKGAYGALFSVRCMVVDHLSRVPLGALNEKRTGDIKTVINEDIEKLERGLAHNLPEFVSYFTGPVVIFIYLCTVNVKLALISLLPLIVVIIIMIFMFYNMFKIMDRANKSATDFNSAIIEYINGMRLIKALNMGSKSFKKFSAAITEENRVWNLMSVKTGPFYAAFIIALESGILFLVPLGEKMLLEGKITSGIFLLFAYIGSTYLAELLPLQQLSMEIAQVLGGVKKVQEILSIKTFEEGGQFPENTDIDLEDVSFSYGEDLDMVLSHANLHVKQGEKIAIVGKSGAGKSTIIQLISRFYDVNEGQVKIGGVDVKDISYEALLQNISIVFQKSFLTSGTILENIRMGQEADLTAVRKAAKEAQIDDFIMSLPKGYDTKLSGIDARLSGGEKQRIAIARAMLKNSKILILDEATSAADPENQKQIDTAIANLCKGKTVLIVAHRLDVVNMCDKVCVVDKNRVDAFGSHKEILQTNEYYKNAWKMYKEAGSIKYEIAKSI